MTRFNGKHCSIRPVMIADAILRLQYGPFYDNHGQSLTMFMSLILVIYYRFKLCFPR